jgi:hypothetical protein
VLATTLFAGSTAPKTRSDKHSTELQNLIAFLLDADRVWDQQSLSTIVLAVASQLAMSEK